MSAVADAITSATKNVNKQTLEKSETIHRTDQSLRFCLTVEPIKRASNDRYSQSVSQSTRCDLHQLPSSPHNQLEGDRQHLQLISPTRRTDYPWVTAPRSSSKVSIIFFVLVPPLPVEIILNPTQNLVETDERNHELISAELATQPHSAMSRSLKARG